MNRNGPKSNSHRRSNGGQNGTPSKWQEFRAARHPEQEHDARKPRNDVPEFLPGQRMFGTVEKMMNSYGFIDVLDSRGRIFFHFSQAGMLIHPITFSHMVGEKFSPPKFARLTPSGIVTI